MPDTHSLNGRVNRAALSVAECQDACWDHADCEGVDWNPSHDAGSQCYLIGPWTTIKQNFRPGITQYLLDRTTDCGASQLRNM